MSWFSNSNDKSDIRRKISDLEYDLRRVESSLYDAKRKYNDAESVCYCLSYMSARDEYHVSKAKDNMSYYKREHDYYERQADKLKYEIRSLEREL